MGNTTFSGAVRSKGGFAHVSTAALTGAETETTVVDANGVVSQALNLLPTEAGVGITAGTGTIYTNSVSVEGSVYKTTIMVDLTGLNCGGTAGDIIGVDGAGAAHLGQITAARNGTIFAGRMTCFEAPTTGDPDINVYSATEATGVEDTAIGDLTETALVDAGDATLGSVVIFTALPAADEYLYLTCGTATAGTYDAGILMIELWGH